MCGWSISFAELSSEDHQGRICAQTGTHTAASRSTVSVQQHGDRMPCSDDHTAMNSISMVCWQCLIVLYYMADLMLCLNFLFLHFLNFPSWMDVTHIHLLMSVSFFCLSTLFGFLYTQE